jgi:hypothetical protein
MLILNKFVSGLKTKFRALQQSKQWTAGSSKSGAFFKAAGGPLRQAQPRQPPALPEGWTHPNPDGRIGLTVKFATSIRNLTPPSTTTILNDETVLSKSVTPKVGNSAANLVRGVMICPAIS